MNRCRSCLIPDTRPDTAFVDGECSACINFKKRTEIDWGARKRQLESILEQGRNGSGFDCVVPSSGGKDSHYQVLTLIEMGARPLVVTASTCHLTEVGRLNIDNLARHATTIEVTPNRSVRARLNRFGLETVGDISYPEHMAIFSIPFKVASDFGIPLLFYGESPQREYGCPNGAEEALTMTRRWVHEFGGLLGLRANDCVGYRGISKADMGDYLLPSDAKLVHTTAYFLGQFLPWDSHLNARIAKKAGMIQMLPSMANWWEHENLDNAQTGLHDYMMYRKYGYGRACAQLSIDIRNQHITRDFALKEVLQRDGLFPEHYMGVSIDEVLEWIELTRDDLVMVTDKFTNWNLFRRVIDEPFAPLMSSFYRPSDISDFQMGELPHPK